MKHRPLIMLSKRGKVKIQKAKFLILPIAIFFLFQIAKADDGYRLWLRYDALRENKSKIYK